MQHDHDGPSGDAAADMQLDDMLALGDTSMADLANSDFVPDLDLADFDDGSLATDPNNPSSNPYHTHPHHQQQQHHQHHHQSHSHSNAAVQPSVEGPSENGAHQNASNNIINAKTDEEDDALMSGVGAGPLPTGFGISLPPNTGSTLTEFTKRRNWSQRVVEEIKDFLHILTPDGRLMYVSPSAPVLTGYDPQDLVGKIMANFIHPDDSGMFMREFHESIASGHPLRFFYRLRKADQTYAIFEAHGHPHFSSNVTPGLSGGNSQGVSFCRGFFMMSRPYPSRNASLLDSFLEHKIENERLKKRIADLNREEHAETQDQYNSKSRPSRVAGPGQTDKLISGSLTPLGVSKLRQDSVSGDSGIHGSAGDSDYHMMPPPAKPGVSNYALTQQNLDEALSASKPDSIKDKMMRYEGANHLEGIEMMTGLRYRDGERSKGISTGAMSPVLVKGDQGIEYPVDRSGRRGSMERTRSFADSPSRAFGAGDAERKKKLKVADEYVCTDCGTLDSPEWRRGPNGPKTLCNACGLRWAKQEKKRTGVPSGSKNGNGDSNNRQSTSAGNGTSGSPTTVTPKPSSSQASPTDTGAPANSTGGSGGIPATTMPVFTGNMASAPPQMSINIAAAQAAQGGAGMAGSPMSGLSPMTTSALPSGSMQNGLAAGGPGMPTMVGGGGGGMAAMNFNHGHRGSLGAAAGMYHGSGGGTSGPQQQGMGRNS